ncbi:hypothetical protein CEQ48_17760 [Vibrio tarriae]|uniref:Nitroreductase domain-containing protein n=2 Tax=Vibrio tarriae TaxID=2014742 RepID=A0AAU8WTI6_9VIBR|nr:hypothetical protein CEQ48_17760 [Vibrio tarriae]
MSDIMLCSKLKPLGRLIKWLCGASYDFLRFIKYGGWRNQLSCEKKRNYYSVKVYHSLEKSMSFSNRNPDSGWGNAAILANILESALHYNNIGFHDHLGFDVLNKFVISNNGVTKTKLSDKVRKKLELINASWPKIKNHQYNESGIINLSRDELLSGVLDEPKKFFESRYSVREFSKERIERGLLLEAIELSLKTPSACNRQPWHVYYISDRKKN